MTNQELKKKNFLSLAEIIVFAQDSGDTDLAGRAMSVASYKGIWEETLGTVTLYRKEGRWL
jgi:hypothetical protein